MYRIAQTLDAHLLTFAASHGIPAGHVDTGNEVFVPPLAPHLRSFIKDEASAAALGPYAPIRHTGVYAVEVVVAAGTGTADAYALAAALVRHFARGSNCGLPGLALKQASVGAHTIKDGRCSAPVTIPYYAHLEE